MKPSEKDKERVIRLTLKKMLRDRSGTTCDHCERRYDDSTCNHCFVEKIIKGVIRPALADQRERDAGIAETEHSGFGHAEKMCGCDGCSIAAAIREDRT